jgi:hypothetical protein
MNEIDDLSLIAKIEAAFRQAARKVVRVAKQTGTPVIIWKDGRVCEIPCELLEEVLTTDKTAEPDR